jgi:hypothetical protein
MKRRNLLAVLVVALACSQMAGYLTGAKTVGACGARSCIAPMAEVFSEVEARDGSWGFEPFASTFILRGVGGDGAAFEQAVTPELLARIEGPQARRAAYATAFTFAPRLAETTWQEAWCHGLGEHGPLRAAFGLPKGARALAMTVASRTDGQDESWVLSPSCTR